MAPQSGRHSTDVVMNADTCGASESWVSETEQAGATNSIEIRILGLII